MSKDIVRKVWDTTPNSEMSELIAWVMESLRIRGQRVRTGARPRECIPFFSVHAVVICQMSTYGTHGRR